MAHTSQLSGPNRGCLDSDLSVTFLSVPRKITEWQQYIKLGHQSCVPNYFLCTKISSLVKFHRWNASSCDGVLVSHSSGDGGWCVLGLDVFPTGKRLPNFREEFCLLCSLWREGECCTLRWRQQPPAECRKPQIVTASLSCRLESSSSN